MPNINFYIDKSKVDKKELIPIKANIAFGNKNHWKTIAKIKITDKWIIDSQRIDPQNKGKDRDRQKEVNDLLQNYENKADNYFKYCLLNDIPITEKLVVDFLNGKTFIKSKNTDIDSIFLEFIAVAKQTTSPKTLMKHKTTQNFLTNYQKDAKIKLTFNDIDDAFLESLRYYAAIIKKHQNNTFFTNISILKKFLRWAKIRKYYTGTAHENFKAPSNDITHISLTFDEIKKLYYFQFTTLRLDRVRDIFCFGCLTGLRREDLIILQREHIKGRFIHITLQKSPVSVIIPIVDAAQRIIDKCDDPIRLFHKISHNNYLKYLKECCDLAGIRDQTQKIKFIGNSRTDRFEPKYKLITGHTSRKTFMTLSCSLGVPRDIVTSITGHQEGGKMVRKYLKVDEEVMLRQMDEAWKKLYQAPGTENSEDKELTETEKLKKEIVELKKIIELQNVDKKISPSY